MAKPLQARHKGGVSKKEVSLQVLLGELDLSCGELGTISINLVIRCSQGTPENAGKCMAIMAEQNNTGVSVGPDFSVGKRKQVRKRTKMVE